MEDITTFIITPYIGVGPIKFGMSKSDVNKILGKANIITKDFIGRTDERRGSISIKYNDKGKVNEISFTEEATVFYEGNDFFKTENILNILEEKEKPYNTVGYKVFFKDGIAITGYSKKKDAKSLSIFSKELEPMWKL